MDTEELLAWEQWLDDGGSLINPPSGWYFTRLEYKFLDDVPATEDVIMVGNVHYWNLPPKQ